jgi:hypothetical protein
MEYWRLLVSGNVLSELHRLRTKWEVAHLLRDCDAELAGVHSDVSNSCFGLVRMPRQGRRTRSAPWGSGGSYTADRWDHRLRENSAEDRTWAEMATAFLRILWLSVRTWEVAEPN